MTTNLPTHLRPAPPPRGSLLPPATGLIGIALCLLGTSGPNMPLALAAVAVLILGCVLLWRPGEPPILLFTFIYPWVQGSVAIFHASALGIDVGEYTPFWGDMHAAILMSLAGVLAVAVGMQLAAGPRRAWDVYALRETAIAQPVKAWFRLYALAWVASFGALSVSWMMPGLTQPALAAAGLRWVFFFMLAVASFVQGRVLSGLFLAAFLLELVTGIGAYFADFRTVLFITFFAALTSGTRISTKAKLGAALLAALVVILAILWTAVKSEYRIFISGGGQAQIVVVDLVARLAKLYELAVALDLASLTSATDQLLRRLTYVEYFAVVLDYVPASMPHTLGAIFWDAIIRPFLPRLLFVDKDVIDDTARTNLYTGGLAGTSEGTSISLGYVAEAYIDFGAYGMFAALLAIGLLYGTIYRVLLTWRRSRGLLGVAVATSVLASVGPLENSFTKVFGGIAVYLVVAVGMILVIIPRWAPWLVRLR